MISVIRDAWSWTGLDPEEVVGTNAFGNYLVRASDGTYWRICPEELSCKRICEDESAFRSLLNDEDFTTDWEMQRLVDLAVRKFGSQPAERCFCLKMPGLLGGGYVTENIGTISRSELMSFAGDVGKQIKDLPDGAKVKIKVLWPGG